MPSPQLTVRRCQFWNTLKETTETHNFDEARWIPLQDVICLVGMLTLDNDAYILDRSALAGSIPFSDVDLDVDNDHDEDEDNIP